jgi:hypothetical protein
MAEYDPNEGNVEGRETETQALKRAAKDFWYPLRDLPAWAQDQVKRWINKREIIANVKPALANAAREAYDRCQVNYKKERGSFRAYAGKSMIYAMIDCLDREQIGAQTSRNSKTPNFQYAVSSPLMSGVLHDLEEYTGGGEDASPDRGEFVEPAPEGALEPLGMDEENLVPEPERLSNQDYRDLKRVALGKIPTTPSEQQSRYLDRILFWLAMKELEHYDRFLHEVAYRCLHEDKTVSTVAKELCRRKASVGKAFDYAQRFLWVRMQVEGESSKLARIRRVWRQTPGMPEPEWDGLRLMFWIPEEWAQFAGIDQVGEISEEDAQWVADYFRAKAR